MKTYVFHYCWHYFATKVLSSSEMVLGYQESLGGIYIRESSNQTVLQRTHCSIIFLSVTYEGLQNKRNTMFSCYYNIWLNNNMKNSMLPATNIHVKSSYHFYRQGGIGLRQMCHNVLLLVHCLSCYITNHPQRRPIWYRNILRFTSNYVTDIRCWILTAEARIWTRPIHVTDVLDKVALKQVLSKHFDFHTINHSSAHLTSTASTTDLWL